MKYFHVNARKLDFDEKVFRETSSEHATHLYEHKGKVFYIEEGQVVEIFIKSRVIVDAAFFEKRI